MTAPSKRVGKTHERLKSMLEKQRCKCRVGPGPERHLRAAQHSASLCSPKGVRLKRMVPVNSTGTCQGSRTRSCHAGLRTLRQGRGHLHAPDTMPGHRLTWGDPHCVDWKNRYGPRYCGGSPQPIWPSTGIAISWTHA